MLLGGSVAQLLLNTSLLDTMYYQLLHKVKLQILCSNIYSTNSLKKYMKILNNVLVRHFISLTTHSLQSVFDLYKT